MVQQMMFLTTIVEYEGAVVDIRPRNWAAHCEAMQAIGVSGPTEEEFWRLFRRGESDAKRVRHGKSDQVAEYIRIRNERINATDLMELDEPVANASANYRLLKQRGNCHLVTFCRNRDGINAALDRHDLWMHFDQKQVLPDSTERRVALLKELAGTTGRASLAIAGTVPFAYAANEAGCRVVGLKDGPTFPNRLRQVGVDVFFDSLDELTDALATRREDLQRIGVV
jgi:phosphoglycolate phosphatase-like HAD superfamily hydrolase